MMILIIGFTCPPTIHFKFITKCDKYDDYGRKLRVRFYWIKRRSFYQTFSVSVVWLQTITKLLISSELTTV